MFLINVNIDLTDVSNVSKIDFNNILNLDSNLKKEIVFIHCASTFYDDNVLNINIL